MSENQKSFSFRGAYTDDSLVTKLHATG